VDRSGFSILLIVVTGCAIAFSPAIRHLWRDRRRKRLMADPFPSEWHTFLSASWRLYDRLPADLRRNLQGCVRVLLDEKRFEACGGLPEVSAEMRLLIAAQAALLIAGRPEAEHRYYPDLVSILIYPGSFRDRGRRTFSLPEEQGEIRLGESWASGTVVLSWHSVRRGAAGEHDGLNVVFHEFAHQIDQTGGGPDGTPGFDDPDDAAQWSALFQDHFDELVDDVMEGRAPLLDEYGASNPAEFFAVSTEAFLERPREMAREMPDLYAALADFYRLDPVQWKKC
jgi:Mlc titration factor MtfA (ptsG expression regulator)